MSPNSIVGNLLKKNKKSQLRSTVYLEIHPVDLYAVISVMFSASLDLSGYITYIT